MSVNRWNPVQEMVSLRDAMDRLFQDSFVRMPKAGNGDGNGHSSAHYLIPPADAWETEDELTIELAVPGVDPQRVDVTFEQDALLISGQIEAPAENPNWILRERARGAFQRRFNLSVPVDVEKVEARVHNGILTVRLPKSEAIKPRKIAVKSA
ncbi:MAG TPA: Hsp20/alpha crystallin family protein [Ardenticatenaceae bacterium]|nr:Hsp20/alpha crystallin family protein [Ardenticatenaceae bacterium]